MNYADIVKNRVIMNKITEYFKANPTKRSVVVKAAVDENTKTYWRAVRQESNKFKVTEVKTATDTYMLQLAESVVRESSPAFSDLSKAFMDAVSGPGDYSQYSNALSLMTTKQSQLQDPKEQQRADAMLQNLSALAKSTRVANKIGASQREARLREAPLKGSPEYQQASTLFSKAMSSMDHSQLSSTLKHMNQMAAKISDPFEKQQFGAMIGGLTGAVDATTAGGGAAVASKGGTKTKGNGFFQGQDKKMGSGAIGANPPAASAQKPAGAYPPAPRKIPTMVKSKRPMNTSRSRSGKVVRESQQLGQASTLFMQAMTPPFDHVKLSYVLKQLNQLVGQIQDPSDRQQMGAMIGTLTGMVDATTAGGGSAVTTRGLQKSHLARFGSVMSEAEKKKVKTILM